MFEANLEALSKKNLGLAAKVAAIATSELSAEFVLTRRPPVLTLKLTEGPGLHQVLLHSRVDPIREADQAVKVLNLDQARLFGVVGMGAGYYVREILEQSHLRAAVVVIEPQPALLRLVMERIDLQPLLASPRVIVVDGSQELLSLKDDLERLFRRVLSLTNVVDFFVTPAYARLWPENCRQLQQHFFDSLLVASRVVGNSAEDSLRGLKQILDNSHILAASPGLVGLEGKLQGIPAFCVAAGPSLNINLHHLRNAQGRGLIICADTILERLLREGIVPDAVCSLERGRLVYEVFYEGKTIPPQVTLVGQALIHPDIFQTFPGKRVAVLRAGLPVEQWIANLFPDLGIFSAGNSVGCMNFALARYLGCSPIVLVGQDLAYGEEGQSHAGGTVYQVKQELDVVSEHELTSIQGKHGQQLRTRKWWKVFHAWFESEIGQTQQPVIDATEGGALIRGATIMTLAEAITMFCRAGSPILGNLLNEPDAMTIARTKEGLRQGLEEQLEIMMQIRKTIREGKRALTRFRRIVLKQRGSLPENLNNYILPVNNCINSLARISRMFFFLTQSLFVKLGRANSDIGQVETREDCRHWAAFQGTFLKEVEGVLDIVLDMLRDSLCLTEKNLEWEAASTVPELLTNRNEQSLDNR